MTRTLHSIVARAAADAATAPEPSRLLNMAEARALVPLRADGRPWSAWWMRARCAPEAKVRFGGRLYWREAGLKKWLAALSQEPSDG